jgi:Papain-like cysteine protease AvrRpt2
MAVMSSSLDLDLDDGSLLPIIVEGLRWERLDFTVQKQEQTQWCWAAVSTSVARFYDGGSGWTQCQMAGQELNRSSCCEDGSTAECNQPWYLDRALSRAGTFAGMEAAPSTGLDPVPGEIGAGRPVCARIAWSGGGGHVVVIEGYRQDNTRIAVEDPWYGSSDVPMSSFRGSYQGSGSWTHYYLTRGSG